MGAKISLKKPLSVWDDTPASFQQPPACSRGESSLLLRTLNAGLAFYNKDDTFANVATMISYAFQLVRDPQQVGCALQDEGVILQGRDSASSGQHGHQIMAHQVVAHIHNVIFFPDIFRGLYITIGECLHRATQDLS